MPKQTIDSLIEGGKATAAPPLGPALGPLGVNIGEVVAKINEVTASFKGMQVPVKVTVDSDTKEFEVEVGTPPAASLIKKEAGVEKGAGNPLADKVADLKIEQIIKIAKMKESSLLGKTTKERVKEIIGTCNSMGVLVEGVSGKEAGNLVDQGKFEKEIREEKTEISAEEMKEQEEEKKRLAEEMKERREEFLTQGKKIMDQMQKRDAKEIRAKMREEEIPEPIIKELVPEEEKKEEAKEGAPEAEKEAPKEEKKESEGKK
jgi:large subunit ribosomal protein L11